MSVIWGITDVGGKRTCDLPGEGNGGGNLMVFYYQYFFSFIISHFGSIEDGTRDYTYV